MALFNTMPNRHCRYRIRFHSHTKKEFVINYMNFLLSYKELEFGINNFVFENNLIFYNCNKIYY